MTPHQVPSDAYIFALAPPDPDKPIRIARFFSYPDQVLYLIASFIGIIVLSHLLSLVFIIYSRRSYSKDPPGARGAISLKRLPIAAVNAFRAASFRWTISVAGYYTLNVAEIFLTAAYAAVLFGWTMVNTTAVTGAKAEVHYWANRAGTIAATQLPIMTALGMRNNIISLLTGVSFDKLNYLHRMSARVLCILVWVHGAGRLKIGLTDEGTLSDRWVQCGFLAVSALTLLCITTLRPVREREYEVFLIVHFVLAFIFLLSVYFHTKARDLVFYGIWPSFLLWGLDRLLRLVRILVFNLFFTPSTKHGSRAPIKTTISTIDVLSPHFLRITVPRPKYFFWRPGQSVYLTFPGITKSPIESHPFTICNISERDDTDDINMDGFDDGLVFLVRVRRGATKRLLESAGKTATGEQVKVILDGPYSSPPLLIGFDTVVLIAGGSGVAFTLPLLLDLLYRLKKGEPGCCRRILFVWAIRDTDHIKWISGPLQRALQGIPISTSVDIRFFITAAEDSKSWADDDMPIANIESVTSIDGSDVEIKVEGSNHGSVQSSEQQVVKDLECVNGATMHQGRPDLRKFLNDEIIGVASGPVSVNVCGTHALSGAVRTVLGRLRVVDVLRGGPSVNLHVEAFGNA